ncbi:hypothetical protein GCM10009779_23030 [Polymorphospora rubra]|uniref:EcsC protein family protein n=2 Tax=Polymorphospora rubra TaxID=338584 RepID=A0A810N603_9ACTN|nr:hypothetical protein Prubr_41990 [Polymorphospora rubra]
MSRSDRADIPPDVPAQDSGSGRPADPAGDRRGDAGKPGPAGDAAMVEAGAVEGTGTVEELSGTVVELTADDLEPAQRKRLLGRMINQFRGRGVGELFKPRAAIRWMADVIGDIAPHVPIRDLETLRRHYGGIEGEVLAERLVRNASRTTAGIGATGGSVGAIQWVATPTLLSAPVLLAAETIAVVAVEVKLIGELHEVYGVPVAGGGAERAVALLQAWSSGRGVNPLLPGGGMAAILGTAARKELRDMLLRRFGRNLTTLGPMLTGAAVASLLNRRATRSLGDRIRDDLRGERKALGGPRPPA